MNAITIHSYNELKAGIASLERSYLLLFKSGTEQSDCALKRIDSSTLKTTHPLFIADVNQVHDIHPRLEVNSAPSLVIFNKGKVVNIIKGCQTEAAYESILSGRQIGGSGTAHSGSKKQVTVYTTPSCSWCTTLKTYLDQHQVQYREVNVASDTSAAEAMMRRSGQQGVPQTEINGQMIVGFDKPRLDQLLEIK